MPLRAYSAAQRGWEGVCLFRHERSRICMPYAAYALGDDPHKQPISHNPPTVKDPPHSTFPATPPTSEIFRDSVETEEGVGSSHTGRREQ